jgi:microcystin degradation protein MlrC
MRTDAGPMRELQDLAAVQCGEGVVEVSVFGGFPYADTVDTGASVLVVADMTRDAGGARAQAVAETMKAAMRRLEPAFAVTLPTPQQGLAQAVEAARAGGLVAVTDPGDNPLSGGVCDTPALFRALLDASIDLPCVFASFADPEAVQRALEAGLGGDCELELGGRVSRDFGAPVRAAFRVERYTDGEFSNTGPMETGVRTSCGRTALLSLRDMPNVQVIVTELVAPANDPGFFTLHGVDLDRVRLLCVKAKNHFRAAFLPLCAAIIDVDAPGPAALDLRLLPFRHARRTH